MFKDLIKVFIIAEAGINHNGSLDLAKKLIDKAALTDVDAIKFQSFTVKDLIIPSVDKALYQKMNSDPTESQTDMLEKLEIDREFHIELINYCKEKNIIFLSTPYDVKSLMLLVDLNVPMLKIASTDTTNLLFLEAVAKTKLPVILSTGMSYLSEIEKAYHCLVNNGCPDIAILRCTSNYPTPIDESNLKSLTTLANSFPGITIGFSDHTEGIGVSPYSVILGARIVEKHFTLDKNMPGPDHKASLDPAELALWAQEIRKAELMLGNGIIEPSKSEYSTKKSLQKCLVANKKITKGSLLDRENIVAKRTGGLGIKADLVYDVIGKKAKCDLYANNIIYWRDID